MPGLDSQWDKGRHVHSNAGMLFETITRKESCERLSLNHQLPKYVFVGACSANSSMEVIRNLDYATPVLLQ